MATILVVDDDSLLRECICDVLTAKGHKVHGAENGCTCLKILDRVRPELVLMDIFMPEMDGIATIMDLREHFPELPVIAMSGGTMLLDSSRYLQVANVLGACRILNKPVSAAELMRAVHDALPQEQVA